MWVTIVSVPRPICLFFAILLILTGVASASLSSINSLKRKRVEVKTEDILNSVTLFYNSPSSSSSTQSTTSHSTSSSQSTTVTQPTQSVPLSRWLIGNHFDLHPPALPQLEDDVLAYQALFKAIMRRDFDVTFLILSFSPNSG